MALVTKLAIYFDDILDQFVIPNTYNLSLPKVKTISGLGVTYTLVIDDYDLNTTLSQNLYQLEQSSDQAFFIIKNFEKGKTLQVHMTAEAPPYKTYSIFQIYVFCGDFCLECSTENTCDVCEDGYEVDITL